MKLLTALALTASLTASALTPTAALLNFAQRQSELRTNKDPRIAKAITSLHSCLTLPAIPAPQGRMFIPHHYLNGSHGPANPAEAEATKPYYAFEDRITTGMNRWLATGDAREAACAQQQIDTWAQAATLLDYDPKESSQAWFQVEWTLSSIAITESFLINAPGLDHDMVQRDIAWMNKVAHRSKDFDQASNQRNNHHYWRGLAATATGVISNDQKLFDWGIAVYKEAVNEIDERGAFPQEMKRNERAVHYQAFALEPLIPLAMLAEQQGVHLFDYQNKHGKSIRDAVTFLDAAIADPTVVKPYIADKQMDFGGRGSVSFAEYYAYHYGLTELPPTIHKLLTTGPTRSTRIGGNTTVLAGVPLP